MALVYDVLFSKEEEEEAAKIFQPTQSERKNAPLPYINGALKAMFRLYLVTLKSHKLVMRICHDQKYFSKLTLRYLIVNSIINLI